MGLCCISAGHVRLLRISGGHVRQTPLCRVQSEFHVRHVAFQSGNLGQELFLQFERREGVWWNPLDCRAGYRCLFPPFWKFLWRSIQGSRDIGISLHKHAYCIYTPWIDSTLFCPLKSLLIRYVQPKMTFNPGKVQVALCLIVCYYLQDWRSHLRQKQSWLEWWSGMWCWVSGRESFLCRARCYSPQDEDV